MKKGLYFGSTLVIAIVVLSLTSCISHQQYRTNYELCTSSNPLQECKTSSIQSYKNLQDSSQDYMLAFIELDDQGQLWQRKQMDKVLTKVATDLIEQDALVVVFVHGWKHSAKVGDDNIQSFRKSLMRLSAMESAISNSMGMQPRKVTGIYLGWRGGSVSWPVLKNLTFWERKETAHKVGYGATTEVLGRLELLRNTKHAIDRKEGKESGTRLAVVGHSFGGAVVYSALSEILEYGFVHTEGPQGFVSDTIGFADLVVLINPAFEAMRYANLSDMATERGHYFPGQLPVLAILTSESDGATKYAFPMGRWFSTLFEKERKAERYNAVLQQTEIIDQGVANQTAVGHFDHYKTHYLSATERKNEDAVLWEFDLQKEVELFMRTAESWEQDHPGSTIAFRGSSLKRTDNSAGRNPYMNIRVDKALIPDHNHIFDPRIENFLQQLILISSQTDALDKRKALRAKNVSK